MDDSHWESTPIKKECGTTDQEKIKRLAAHFKECVFPKHAAWNDMEKYARIFYEDLGVRSVEDYLEPTTRNILIKAVEASALEVFPKGIILQKLRGSPP